MMEAWIALSMLGAATLLALFGLMVAWLAERVWTWRATRAVSRRRRG